MSITSCFNRRTLFVLAMAAGGFATSAHAQTKVLFDFGDDNTYRGVSTASPDSHGNYWNNIHTGAYFANVIDTTGAPTPVGFGFATNVGTDSYNGPAGDVTAPSNPADPPGSGTPAQHVNDFTLSPSLGDLAVNTAAIDYFTNPQNRTLVGFALNNLDSTKTYTLTFFGSHEYSDDPTTVYEEDSDPAFQNTIASTTLNVNDPANPGSANLSNTATLANMVPQPDGNIYIDFIGNNFVNLGYLNSMELTINSVPEPTSMLLASGVAFLGLRRRR